MCFFYLLFPVALMLFRRTYASQSPFYYFDIHVFSLKLDVYLISKYMEFEQAKRTHRYPD